jgi:periplasmic protein CpxP/Spy
MRSAQYAVGSSADREETTMVRQQKIVLLTAGLAGALVAAVLLVGAVAEVAAQDGRGRPGFARGGSPGGLGLLGPVGAGLDGASLTDAQKQQVKSIVEAHRDDSRGLLDRQAQARRALAASADSGQVDTAAATEVGNASAALALAEARLRVEVLQVLTPEQRAAVQQRAAERAERFKERRERQ